MDVLNEVHSYGLFLLIDHPLFCLLTRRYVPAKRVSNYREMTAHNPRRLLVYSSPISTPTSKIRSWSSASKPQICRSGEIELAVEISGLLLTIAYMMYVCRTWCGLVEFHEYTHVNVIPVRFNPTPKADNSSTLVWCVLLEARNDFRSHYYLHRKQVASRINK